jgi:hypothetical protein
MPQRNIDAMEIQEVLRRVRAGASYRAIERSVNIDRKRRAPLSRVGCGAKSVGRGITGSTGAASVLSGHVACSTATSECVNRGAVS